MVGWGLASMANHVCGGSASFYVLRLILGVLEAGFFPGAVLYLTYWFPNRMRGEILGLFYLGIPISLIIGGPLSGLLLEMPPWAGLQAGNRCFSLRASWLLSSDLRVLVSRQQARRCKMAPSRGKARSDRLACLRGSGSSLGRPIAFAADAAGTRAVLRFVFIYALLQISTYGAIFYLPQKYRRSCTGPLELKSAWFQPFPGSVRWSQCIYCRARRIDTTRIAGSPLLHFSSRVAPVSPFRQQDRGSGC